MILSNRKASVTKASNRRSRSNVDEEQSILKETSRPLGRRNFEETRAFETDHSDPTGLFLDVTVTVKLFQLAF